MILNEIYSSIRYQIAEDTLQDWFKGVGNGTVISTVTAKRALPLMQGINRTESVFYPNTANAVLYGSVGTAKDYGKWDDRPNYDPAIIPFSSGNGYPMKSISKSTGRYNPSIQWDPWVDHIANLIRSETEKEQEQPNDIIEMIVHDMFHTLDAQLHCNCPAFYWQGMAYAHTAQGLAQKDQKVYTPSGKWRMMHDVNTPICKHLVALLMDVDNNTDYYIELFYRELEKIYSIMQGWAFEES
jgi:hypothetical protein